MTDFLKKAIYIGLGLASATKERAESMAEDVANQTRMSEEEGRKFAEYLKKESTKARKDLQNNIQNVVDDALDRVPTLGRIRHIERRLDALEKSVGVETPPPAEGTPDVPDLSAAEARAEAQDEPRK